MTDIDTEALRLAAADLLKERLADTAAASKAALAHGMNVGDRKTVVVDLGGDRVKVASIAYVEGRKGAVTARVEDTAAFIAWAKQDNPAGVQTVEVVLPWFEQEALQRATVGEVIPGVDVTESDSGKPYIRVQRDKADEPTGALLAAMFADDSTGLRSLIAPRYELEA